MMHRRLAMTALTLLLIGGGQAAAGQIVIYTLNDTTNQVSATATFSAVNGGLKIAVVNTEANTPDAGHAISQLQFTFGGNVRPTSFTELAGTETDFLTLTQHIDVTPPTETQHWSFGTSDSTADLWTVDGNGLNGYGGQPTHLIAASGSTPDASLTNDHLPSFIGEVDFFLADPTLVQNQDLTLADITGVQFSFGTGPEVNFEAGTATVSHLPEPPSLTMLGIGGMSLLAYGWRRRKRVAA
jgi:hypothetical protein